MGSREKRLTNLRWYCDQSIEAARLQRARVLEGGATRHDIDFYLLSVWRLQELARQAGTMGAAEAAEVQAAMAERWPLLRDVRNWWTHARDIEWTTWFSDAVYRLGPGGSAVVVIDVKDDHDEVERFYERMCRVLGPLPE